LDELSSEAWGVVTENLEPWFEMPWQRNEYTTTPCPTAKSVWWSYIRRRIFNER